MSNDIHTDDIRRDDRSDAAKGPEALEREVDQARSRLGRTANELSDRLSPGEIMDQALGMAREHGGEFGRNLGTQVKNNPLPLILTSVGITWMMMASGNNGTTHPYVKHDMATGTSSATSTGAGQTSSGVKDKLGNAAAKSRDKAGEVGDRMHGAAEHARESMQDATGHAGETAQNARDSLAHFYRDQPLLAGSLGIAIGAALGALVPATEMEDDMFGEKSDRSIDAAKSTASRKYDEVRESARTQTST